MVRKMIELQPLAVFYGPNPYSRLPVIVNTLQLEIDLYPNAERMHLKLLERYPEWLERPPDFVQSTVQGLANALVLWAQKALNEVRGCVEVAGVRVKENGALLWLGFHDPEVSREALNLALQASLDDFSIDAAQDRLTRFWEICRRRHPDYQARILIQAAEANDVPWRLLVRGGRHWQFGWGKRSRIFFESASNEDGSIGSRISGDKAASKALFATLGIPTPTHRLVQEESELKKAIRGIGYPCVIKPLNGGGGKGVSAGIINLEELRRGFLNARRYSDGPLMVEAFVYGDDHRLMVINGRLTHAIRREASFLVGDGTSRIFDLLDILNAQRSINIVKSRYLQQIPTDNILLQHLEKQGVDLRTVLKLGQKITLRSNANLSTGGICTDVTEHLHPDTRLLAESLASSMGLMTAGLDFITTNIEKSCSETGEFIEINTTPGLSAMISAGSDPIEIGRQVLGSTPGRIPIMMVVVTSDKLQTAKDWFQARTWSRDTGFTCAKHASLGGVNLHISDIRHWSAVHALLHHQTLASLWILCEESELFRWGLPVDQLEKTWLCGITLPNAWQDVVAKFSLEIESLGSWTNLAAEDMLS